MLKHKVAMSVPVIHIYEMPVKILCRMYRSILKTQQCCEASYMHLLKINRAAVFYTNPNPSDSVSAVLKASLVST